jgi:hypothetical protein
VSDEFDLDEDEALEALDDEDASGRGYQLGKAIGALLAAAIVFAMVLALIGCVILFFWALVSSDPGDVEPQEGVGYIELVVSERWVVWALRLMLFALVGTLLFVALFVIGSIVVRASKGQWLRSAGGFHADTAERELREGQQLYDELLSEAQSEKDELVDQLAMTVNELERVREQRDFVVDRLVELDPKALD